MRAAKVGKTGGRSVANLSKYATLRPPVRRFLFPSVPLLGTGSGDASAFAPDIVAAGRAACLPRSRMCSSPTRRGRSARRGTSGRNLPGRQATLAHRRRRRSFPTKHRRDCVSRWEELPRMIREVARAGINETKNLEKTFASQGIQGLRRREAKLLFTSGRSALSSRHLRAEHAEGSQGEDHFIERSGMDPRVALRFAALARG